MKALKIFPIAASLMAITFVSFSQSKSESFKVSGNCGMCKTRIEKAAKEAGASEANWDTESKQLTVTYISSVTNTAKIQQKIAEAGHDNDGFKASIDVYNNLPGCCKYDKGTGDKKMACCSDKCDMKDGKCVDMAACKEKGCCKDEETCKANGCCTDKAKNHDKMDCCKDGKCTKEGHDGKDCCKKDDGKMDCCKNGKCTKEGHNGKDCCKKDDGKRDCCKDGKCTKEGHDGKDCCKKS